MPLNRYSFETVEKDTIFMTKLAISSLHPFCLCFKVGQHERHSDPSLTFHTVWRRVRLFHVHSSSATASRQARYSSRSPYSQSRCSHGAPRSTLLPRYSSCRKRSPTACLAHLQEHRLCNGWVRPNVPQERYEAARQPAFLLSYPEHRARVPEALDILARDGGFADLVLPVWRASCHQE